MKITKSELRQIIKEELTDEDVKFLMNGLQPVFSKVEEYGKDIENMKGQVHNLNKDFRWLNGDVQDLEDNVTKINDKLSIKAPSRFAEPEKKPEKDLKGVQALRVKSPQGTKSMRPVTQEELKNVVKEELKKLLSERGFGEGEPAKDELSKKREVYLEEEDNIAAQTVKAAAALEKNSKMDAAIDQYVKKILANPNATQKVLAQADKLGVSQGDDPAKIALKATQQGNIQEIFGSATHGAESKAGATAETVGMALGLGGAAASSLAGAGFNVLAAVSHMDPTTGFVPVAMLAGGALAGHIMKRVLDASSKRRVQGLAGSAGQQDVESMERIRAKAKARQEIEEKKLTKPEKKEKEKIVKGMKRNKDDFEKRYPGRGEEVMYATATKMAKKRK